MKIINDIASLSTLDNEKFGVTIGNFDGFHLGHQKIISSMLNLCHEQNVSLLVMTFVPHPRIVLHSEKKILINDYEDRRKFMEKNGVETLCEINFSRQFSELGPDKFLNDYILKTKRIKRFFLGHDFSFGKDKKGNQEFLKRYCQENGIAIEILDEFRQKEKISSSHIRNLLNKGNIKKSNELLGREFFLRGEVVHGCARGKNIGFPTANLDLKEDLLVPDNGVYSTKIVHQGKIYASLTNIGFNPTVQDTNNISVETHILDFDKNIYGEEIKIIFMDKIREEKKFQSFGQLKEQIACDMKTRRGLEF